VNADSTVAPELRDGVAGWSFPHDAARVLFLGRGTPPDRAASLPVSWLPAAVGRARLRQVHGDVVREAVSGAGGGCGEGDALVTTGADLALEIATADCVPVLLASPAGLGAAHAGWRGVVAEVVTRTVERLGERRAISAWIGPAIGGCCYEVEEDRAALVAAACRDDRVVVGRTARGRPLLDLVTGVEGQLRRAGVERITTLRLCTRCHPEWLWSYRRDGAGAGRNLALIWR
jgi:YfiH family protein